MCLVGLILSIIVGLIPTIIYGWFVNWLDQHEKEPWWLLALSFLWGAIPAVILALIAQILLDIPPSWVLSTQSLAYEVTGSSIWAPLTEELTKGLGVILILVFARREIDSLLDGIIYGAMAGLGFAFTENILYFGGSLYESGWGSWAVVVLLRTIPFGLNHALFTGLTGLGLAAAYLNRNRLARITLPVLGLAAGMVFHAIHNLGASLAVLTCWSILASLVFDWGGVLLVGILVVIIWRQEKSWLQQQLAGEVSDDLFHTLTSWRQWQQARFQALFRGDFKGWHRLRQLRQTATELAFKKHRATQGVQDARLIQEMEQHRQRLAELVHTPQVLVKK